MASTGFVTGSSEQADPDPRSRRSLLSYQRVTLVLLFLAGAINFFDRSSLSVANTTVRAEMHLSGTQMGWLLTAFSLAYGLCQLPLVSLLHRFGARPVLGAGLTLWSVAQMLTGFVPGLSSFLALRVLLGAGESPFYPAGVQAVSDWFSPASRGKATAVMNASQTIGLAAAPPLLSWLILRVGWRHTFAALGLSGVLVAAAWFVLYRDRASTLLQATGSSPAAANPWKLLLRRRSTWGIMLGFSGVAYTNWLYISWVPGYLQTMRHLSLAASGWAASIPFLGGALGMLVSGSLTDTLAQRGFPLRAVHRANLIAGMAASAACTLLVAHSSTTPVAIAGLTSALFFIHYAGTSGWGYVQTVAAKPYVASLSAMQNFAGFLIASAAPVLTGWLLDRTQSFTLAFELCSGITLLGALSYATLALPGARGGVD